MKRIKCISLLDRKKLKKNMNIGEKIKTRRKEMGFTQSELANLIEVNQSVIANYERGEYEPKLHKLKELSLALEVKIDELLK